MIDIMEINACVPVTVATIDKIAKKHVNLFTIPCAIAKIETKDIAYPNDCCTVATSKSFLITWFIFNFLKMNPKHVIDDTIPKIKVII